MTDDITSEVKINEEGQTYGKITSADGKVYHKSKTANATVAPTNEATIAKAQGAGLPPDTLQFITIVDYEWNLHRDISYAALEREYGYTEAELTTLFENPVVTKALEERGIAPVGPTAPVGTKQAKLTPIQLIAANKLLDLTDTRSTRKKLQDLGVSSTQYQAWLRNPDFSGYLRERAEALLGDSQHEASLALLDKVSSGDIKAIELYMELTGRYVRKSAEAQSGPDLSSVIVRIIEIVIDEVDDPNVAARIGDRLKGLVTGAQVAGMLVSNEPEVVVPEIATSREITTEVRELMDKGLGYDG